MRCPDQAYAIVYQIGLSKISYIAPETGGKNEGVIEPDKRQFDALEGRNLRSLVLELEVATRA